MTSNHHSPPPSLQSIINQSTQYSHSILPYRYSAFRAVQTSVQALSAFSSNRICVLQDRLRSDICRRCPQHGCAGVLAAIEGYTRALSSGLFLVNSGGGGSGGVHAHHSPCSDIVGLLIEEWLDTSRAVLERLWRLVNVNINVTEVDNSNSNSNSGSGSGSGKSARSSSLLLVEPMAQLDRALQEHCRIKEAIVQSAHLLVDSSNQEDAAILLMYMS